MRKETGKNRTRNTKKAGILGACLTAGIVLAGIGAEWILLPEMSVNASENERNAVNGKVTVGQGTASIRIYGNKGQTLQGKTFVLYELFHAENAQYGESVRYTFHDAYASVLKSVTAQALSEREKRTVSPSEISEYHVIDYIQSLNTDPTESAHDVQNPEGRYSEMRLFVERLRDAFRKQGVTGTPIYVKSTDEDNTVTVSGLPYGYYVIDEEHVSQEWSAASLCMTGTANPTAVMHVKSDYPAVIKKIQEDDRLYSVGNDGWNDIGDYETGQDIPYRFETSVCDMNGYDTYYYAWHDRMDPALTFQGAETVSIVLTDGKKTYTMDPTEYCVITEKTKLENGDSFRIEIRDIKEIIDREFDRIDDRGHNDYSGLTVTLSYLAVLNEKAAEQKDGAGFENHVRLEFSNDPDSDGVGHTGFTPWDTTVCFTFQLNGTKKNEKGALLENAVFRLYSDEACENEVYVKKGKEPGSYIVINRDSLGGDDHTGGTVPEEGTEIVSGENGQFVITGLDQGMYYLKEMEAPAGYRPLTAPVVLTVEPVYTDARNQYIAGESAAGSTLRELHVSAHVQSFLDGDTKEDDLELQTDLSGALAELEIVNQTGSKLPVTGSAAMPLLVFSGTVLAGGAVLTARKMRQDEK